MLKQQFFTRKEFVRPITVAVAFTLSGELLIFLIWGVTLFPAGTIWHKFVWTMTCGVAMGATIGSLVNVFVTGRIQPRTAPWLAGAIYFSVLAMCVALCYRIDLSKGYFGASEAPLLFILGGLLPALLTSLVYPWVLYSRKGLAILTRCGL